MSPIPPPPLSEYPTPAARVFAWAEALRQNPHEPEDHAAVAQVLADVLRSETHRAALIDILIDASAGHIRNHMAACQCGRPDCTDWRIGVYSPLLGIIDVEQTMATNPARRAAMTAVKAAAQHEALPDRDRALSMIASHQAAAGDVVRMLFNLYALLLDTTPPTIGDPTP